MTSQKKWPIIITLFLILGLFLVACERPLPDDGSGDAPTSGPPVESDTEAYPEPGQILVKLPPIPIVTAQAIPLQMLN